MRIQGLAWRFFASRRHGDVDDAWFDDGNPNIERLHFLTDRFAQSLEREFGSDIRRERRKRHPPSDGSHIDNTAALILVASELSISLETVPARTFAMYCLRQPEIVKVN